MALIRWQRPNATWSGFEAELDELRREMDRLMESPFGQMTSPRFMREWAPAVDIYHNADNVFVKVEIPGFKKEDLEVSLHDGALTVSGERKDDEREGQTRRERFFGRFSRTVTLPVPVDGAKVAAHYENGILTVTLPKAEEAKPKQIEINVK